MPSRPFCEALTVKKKKAAIWKESAVEPPCDCRFVLVIRGGKRAPSNGG